MVNLIKKLILWVNENPKTSAIIAATACIPIAIFSAILGWEIVALAFGAFAFCATLFWLVVIAALIIHGLAILWKKLVAWAEQ